MQARIRDRANAFTELSQDHKEELGYIYANDVSTYDIPYLLEALQEAQTEIEQIQSDHMDTVYELKQSQDREWVLQEENKKLKDIIETRETLLKLKQSMISKLSKNILINSPNNAIFFKDTSDSLEKIPDDCGCELLQKSQDRERVLREALEFYAIKDNYQEQLVSNEDDGWDIYRKPTIVLDNGKIAREALGQEGK